MTTILLKYLIYQHNRYEVENIFSHIDLTHPLCKEWAELKNSDVLVRTVLSKEKANDEIWSKIIQKINLSE